MSQAERLKHMHAGFTLGRWHVLLSLVSIGALVALATMPQLLGDQVTEAFHGLMEVSPAWLWLAALSFATALAASGCAWRSALTRCGGELTRADASARYGVGSLVNAFLPAKIGSAVRFALFARVLHTEGRVWTTGGVCASIGAARAIWLGLLLGFGAASGVLPLWPLALIALAVVVAVGIAYFARDRSPSARVAHVLDAFRALGRSPRAAAQLVGWIGVATAARVGAATAIAAAFGVERPLLAALLVVPALDLAGILPITPGEHRCGKRRRRVRAARARRPGGDSVLRRNRVQCRRDGHEPRIRHGQRPLSGGLGAGGTALDGGDRRRSRVSRARGRVRRDRRAPARLAAAR